jgi:hypothetical protein
MNSKVTTLLVGSLILVLLIWGQMTPLAQEDQNEFTSVFPIQDCVFVTQGTNDFFNISPGRQMMLNNRECFQAGECEVLREVTITVLNETRNINFLIDDQPLTVDTRVVLKQVTLNGRLVESERGFFAECQDTQDVYQFGKTVQIITEDGRVTTEGTWLAGVDEALPGLIFPGGAFLLGSRYFQELAPEVALNRAEHVALGLDVEVPAGTFESCVEVRETTGLDTTQVSTKTYCPGTGLVIDDEVKLIEATDGSVVDDGVETVF